MSVFPDGVFQYGGEPVGGVRFTSPWATTYFVDGDNGNAANSGLKPTLATALLTTAVAKAGEEDIIYVRPMGASTDASDFYYYADGATITVPYASVNLSIIGVTPHRHKPYYGPWFRFGYGASDTGYVLDNYAPGLCLENLGFQTGDYIRTSYGAVRLYSSTTGGAYTTHAGSVGCSIYNCFFRDGQITINGGYDTVIAGSTFEASSSSNTGIWSIDNALPTGGHRIIGCHFNEMFADNQPLRYIYFVAGQQVNFYVHECYFGLVPADNHYMWFGASSKGLVDSCYFENADISTGANDSNSELYSADGGVQFTNIHDGSRAAPGAD